MANTIQFGKQNERGREKTEKKPTIIETVSWFANIYR